MSLTLVSSNKRIWSFATMFALTLIGLLVIFSLKTAQAASPGERVVTIHDQSLETTIVTQSDTVVEALRQAKIQTSAYDNVDPGLDTKLTGTSYQINIYRAQPVMVIDGITKKSIMTAHQTPNEIAKDAGLRLYDEDIARLTRSPNILNTDGSGLALEIDRSTRFILVLYGKVIETGTQEDTVAGMIKAKKIKLGKNDTVSLPAGTKITTGTKVEIWRNGKQTINEEQPIAFSVQQIQDANQPVGYRAIKTAGVLGKKIVTYEVEMTNGQETARREIQSVQTLAPQAQAEIIGTKPSFSGSFAEALARLRSCESGGNYANKRNPTYRGAYQYSYSTWANYQGYSDPADAPPAVQDQAAWETYKRRGWQPWPHCGSSLPDSYR